MQKKAITFMIISALAFALLNVFVKSLNQFNVYQIVFFRSIGTLLFTFPFLIRNRIPILGNQKGLLLLRGFVGFTAMTLFFMSLKHLSIGSAVSIRYISPIFAAVFALIFLKETIKKIQWLYFGIAFLGVLILKGFDNQMNSIGLIYVLISSIFTGIVFIVIRKIANKDHPQVIVNYFMVISAVLSGFLVIKDWINPKGIEWLTLLGLGVFGYFGQLFMTKSIQEGEINQVAPLKYAEVIFTMIIGVIWLNEVYSLLSMFGILLIILGLSLNLFSKKQKSKSIK